MLPEVGPCGARIGTDMAEARARPGSGLRSFGEIVSEVVDQVGYEEYTGFGRMHPVSRYESPTRSDDISAAVSAKNS